MSETTRKPAPLLALRSWFSLLSGSPSPAKLCAAAARAGYQTVSLLDEGNLYGLPDYVAQARLNGLRALAGARLALPGGHWLYLWARTRAGFGRLCGILSASLVAEGNARGYDPLEDLLSGGWDGLVVASADRAALARYHERGRAAGRNDADRAAYAGRPDSVWPWYAALVQGQAFRSTALYAKSLDLPLLAVADCVLLDTEDLARQRLLAAVAQRRTLSSLYGDAGLHDPAAVPGKSFLPEADQAIRWFSAWPEALRNAGMVEEACEPAASFLSPVPVFPEYRDPQGRETQALLRFLCEQALPARYGHAAGGPVGRARQRLERELRIIGAKGFASYFLLVRDIVGLCPRTCGRGSAASSIVSYLLGITHVDPLEHDLFFERFLNEGRTDPPDIDIDFPWDERDAVLREVFRRWPGASAMVADHCCFRGRGRVREVALAYGKTEAECAELSRQWRMNGSDALPAWLKQAAALLEEVPRYIGTHPGGVVITPRPTWWYSHTQTNSFGYPVLAWEKEGVEQAGLVKIDLLGNRSLAVLRDCISLATVQEEKAGRPPLRWDSFNPLTEAEPRRLIESGRTIGIFYIESPATRQLLTKMRQADFEHLVVASSIIRPAANKYINEYVRRLRGESWQRLDPAVEETLAGTLGIMVYQEDVSRVAMAAAGFSAAEADTLRKIVAKKRGAPVLLALKDQFFRQCAERGITADQVTELWNMMESFAGYSFCKAHSASYALVSYRLAWMKYWYPGYFICSVINNGGGFYATQTYLDEAVRLGYTLLPPCVNASVLGYTVEEGPGRRIRVGLNQLQDASRACLERLVEERAAHGPFRDFCELLDRVPLELDDCRALVRSGACDSLGQTESRLRPELMWLYHQWQRGREKRGTAAKSRTSPPTNPMLTKLPAGQVAPARTVEPCVATAVEASSCRHHSPQPALFSSWAIPPGIRDYAPATKLADELRFLGVIVSRDLAGLFRDRACLLAARHRWPEPVGSARLGELIGRRISLLGVHTAAKEVSTVHGDSMCFKSFTDSDGVYETVLFPKVYERLVPILEYNTVFLLLGTVHVEYGALSVHIEALDRLNRCG